MVVGPFMIKNMIRQRQKNVGEEKERVMYSGWRRESRRANKRWFVNCLFDCLLRNHYC